MKRNTVPALLAFISLTLIPAATMAVDHSGVITAQTGSGTDSNDAGATGNGWGDTDWDRDNTVRDDTGFDNMTGAGTRGFENTTGAFGNMTGAASRRFENTTGFGNATGVGGGMLPPGTTPGTGGMDTLPSGPGTGGVTEPDSSGTSPDMEPLPETDTLPDTGDVAPGTLPSPTIPDTPGTTAPGEPIGPMSPAEPPTTTPDSLGPGTGGTGISPDTPGDTEMSPGGFDGSSNQSPAGRSSIPTTTGGEGRSTDSTTPIGRESGFGSGTTERGQSLGGSEGYRQEAPLENMTGFRNRTSNPMKDYTREEIPGQ